MAAVETLVEGAQAVAQPDPADGQDAQDAQRAQSVQSAEGAKDVAWLARALEAVSLAKAHVSLRERKQLARVLAEGGFPAGQCKVVAGLFGRLNIRPARWRACPVKDQLPAVAVIPDVGFGVVYGQSTDGLWLVDTPSGRRRMETFPEGAVFAAALAKPPLEEARTALGLFKQVFNSDRSWLFQMAFASLIGSALALATSLYSMQVYDRVISTGGVPTLVVLCVGVSISILIELVVKAARASIITDAVHDIDVQFGNGVFERMLRIRLDQFPANVGTLAAQVRGFETVRNFRTALTQYLVADAPFALFFVLVIFLIGGPALAAVPAAAFTVAFFVGFLFKEAIQKHAGRGVTVGNRRQGFLVEAIHGAETLKSTGGGWGMLGRWGELSRQTSEETQHVKRLSDLSTFFAASIQQVSYVALVTVGAWLAISGSQLTMGSIIACSIISGRVLTPINQLPGLMVQWGHAKVALKNLEKLFELECENEGASTPLAPETILGEIRINNAEFAYAGQPQPMAVSELQISAGERVAVVGAIGAGKSTLLKLMAGLCKPQRGNVFLDGLDIYQIDPDRRAETVGYLPQRNRLFAGTLRDNLRLGLPDLSDDQILAAAEITGLADLIRSRSEGLDLPVPEGGEGLSGGQAQLVALTRMLLAEPALWLLDEPTASMDDVSELRCLQALRAATAEGKTLVVVTHKMRLLELVDRIVVLTPQGVALDGARDEVLGKLQKAASTSGSDAARESAAPSKNAAEVKNAAVSRSDAEKEPAATRGKDLKAEVRRNGAASKSGPRFSGVRVVKPSDAGEVRHDAP